MVASIHVAAMPSVVPSMRDQASGLGEAKNPSRAPPDVGIGCQPSGIIARTGPAVTSENGDGERWMWITSGTGMALAPPGWPVQPAPIANTTIPRMALRNKTCRSPAARIAGVGEECQPKPGC